MSRLLRSIICAALGATALLAAPAAVADLPAGYVGKPFDPAVAGGPKCPPTVKAGPYAIPGRLDFVNYDIGGDGITFHTGDHIVKGGTGYRIDHPPTATFSLTTACAPTCPNVWYNTSPALDGTVYPSPTTGDFSIGAVQNGDWVDITVNVATMGTYSLSSTWATGNGPPGGEGGNGDMALSVFSNGTKLATWTAVFPNFNMYADFRHWKAYPNFASVTLTAGPQVIKLQSGAKHLQLDYVQFDLVGADGGATGGDASAAEDGGATGAGGSGPGGATGGGGSSAGGGAGGGAVTGAAGDGAVTGGAGSPGAGGTGTADAAGGTGTAGGTGGATSTGAAGASGQVSHGASSGCACAIAGRGTQDWPTGGGLLLLGCALLGRRRARTASTPNEPPAGK
jgi:hypothetical protein